MQPTKTQLYHPNQQHENGKVQRNEGVIRRVTPEMEDRFITIGRSKERRVIAQPEEYPGFH